MKVYCVYQQIGEDYSVVKIYADKSKAQGYVDRKNFISKRGWRWFFQETEVIQ
jgi:hypothetical protein